MWNPFKRNKQNKLQELRDLSAISAILNEFERHGLIHWQRRDKILVIEESLVKLKLAEGRSGFLKFLNQVAMWQNNNIVQEAYEAHRLKVETEAVRKAQAQFAMLTKGDLQRIRQNAREQMPIIPLEQLKFIKEFDIFVVRADAPSLQDATKEDGHLLALGHYDGEKVEMAMYEDIKYILYDRPES